MTVAESPRSEPPVAGSEPTGPLARTAAVGTLWLTAQKWAVRVGGLVTVAILTRLLQPGEFGVVAAAGAVTPLVLVLSDLGFSTYIVQAEKVDDRNLSTGFWFTMTGAFVLSGMLVGGAPLIAGVFGIPASTNVLRVLSLSVLLVIGMSVPVGLLRRRLEFRRLAIQSVVSAVVGQVAAIGLAFAGTGAWALVAQLVLTQLVGFVMAWHAAAWRPRLQFSRVELREMGRFGAKVVSVELIATTRGLLETAVVANVLGATILGYLTIAQRLIQVAQDLGASTLVQVSTVVFAKVRDDLGRIRSAYVRAQQVSYAVIAPIMTFTAVAGPVVVPVIFGSRWLPAVPVTQALAVAAILTLGAGLDNGLFYGMGRPGRWLTYAAVTDAVTLGTTFAVARHGLLAVGLGFVCVAFAATVARWFLVGRELEMAWHVPARALLGAAVAAAASAGAGWLVLLATRGLPHLPSAMLIGGGLLAVHVAVIRLAVPDTYRAVVELLPASPLRRLRWPLGRVAQPPEAP